MKIHHLGYLTKRLNSTLDEFLRLGYRVEQESAYDDVRDVHIAFVIKDGYRIELIEPAGEASPLAPLLAKYKNTAYHICYEVENLDEATEELSRSGYTVIQQPAPAPCIEGRRVVFLMHRSLGMIELLEA